MKKNVITLSAVLTLSLAALVYSNYQQAKYSLFYQNVEALADDEQPNALDCIYDPNWVCVALHPTDPNKDIEIEFAKWWEH